MPLALLYAAILGGFAAVSVIPEVLGLPTRAFSIGFRVLVLVLVAACFAGWVRAGRAVHSGPVWVALGVFWFMFLLRLSADLGVPGGPLPRAPADYVLFAIGIVLLPMIAMLELPGRSTLRAAWLLSLCVVAFAALGILWLLYSGGIAIVWDNRLSTEVINPISVGYIGVTLVVLCAARPFDWRTPGVLGVAVLPAVRVLLAILGSALTVASGSRGPMIALAGAMIAWLALSPVRFRGRIWRITGRMLLVVGAGVAVAAAAITIGDLIGVNPFERLEGLLGDESTSYREQAIVGSLAQFADRPLFGDALIERSTFDYPHNVYVESLMSVGIVGTLGLVVFSLAAIISSWRLLRTSPDAQWVALLCLVHVFAALTSGALYLSDSFWAMSAAAISAASRRGLRLEWQDSKSGTP